jgi:hypothetical protein
MHSRSMLSHYLRATRPMIRRTHTGNSEIHLGDSHEPRERARRVFAPICSLCRKVLMEPEDDTDGLPLTRGGRAGERRHVIPAESVDDIIPPSETLASRAAPGGGERPRLVSSGIELALALAVWESEGGAR